MNINEHRCRVRQVEAPRSKVVARLLRWTLVVALSASTFAVLAPPASARVDCDPPNEDTGVAYVNAPNGTYHRIIELYQNTCSSGIATRSCVDDIYQNGYVGRQSIRAKIASSGRVGELSSDRNGSLRGINEPRYSIRSLKPYYDDPNFFVVRRRAMGDFAYTGTGYVLEKRSGGSGAKYRWTFYYPNIEKEHVVTAIVTEDHEPNDAIVLQRRAVTDRIDTAHNLAQQMRSVEGNKNAAASIGAILVTAGVAFGRGTQGTQAWPNVVQQAFWIVLGTCGALTAASSYEAKNVGRDLLNADMAVEVELHRLRMLVLRS